MLRAYNTIRSAIFGRIQAEILAIVSLIIVLSTGVMWKQDSILKHLFVWLIVIWWQRFLASGGLTFTILPTWKTILPLICLDQEQEKEQEQEEGEEDSNNNQQQQQQKKTKTNNTSSSTNNNNKKKIVFITGANSGCGFFTAEALLNLGYTIIISCRTKFVSCSALGRLAKATDLKDDRIFYPSEQKRGLPDFTSGQHRLASVEMELDSLDSVRACAEQLQGLLGPSSKLHAAVLNAGAMFALQKGGKPDRAGYGNVERNLGCNFVSHLALQDELLKRDLFVNSSSSSSPRIVWLSSIGHVFSSIFGGASKLRETTKQANKENPRSDAPFGEFGRANLLYCDSKFCDALAALEPSDSPNPNVKKYSLHPGLVLTAFFNMVLGKFPPKLGEAVRMILSVFGKFPIEGCASSVYCVVSKSSLLENGAYHTDATSASGFPAITETCKDKELSKDILVWARETIQQNTSL